MKLTAQLKKVCAQFHALAVAQRRKNLSPVRDVHEFEKIIKTAGRDELIAVYFTAEWSAECAYMLERFAAYSVEFPTTRFLVVDVDKCYELAMEARLFRR